MNMKSSQIAATAACAVLFFSVAHCGYANEILIVGIDGEVITSSNGKVDIVCDGEQLSSPIQDSYLHRASKKLFICDDSCCLYEMDLSESEWKLSPIDTGKVPVYDILFDMGNHAPAWLDDKEPRASKRKLFTRPGKGARSEVAQKSNIAFVGGGSTSSLHIDQWRSSQSLMDSYPSTQDLLVRFPDDQWLIEGRSEHIAVYGRKIAHVTKMGEKYRSTKLFHNRESNVWALKDFDESVKFKVYEDAAIGRGFFDMKGDRDPNGNQVQREPSGNWYFYIPAKGLLVQHVFEAGTVVHYATAEEAYLTRGRNVLRFAIHTSEESIAQQVVALPAGVKPHSVYPFDAVGK